MGVATPWPGIATLHLMLVVSFQFSGGSPCGATPFAAGPRHSGQLCIRSAAGSAFSAGFESARIGADGAAISKIIRSDKTRPTFSIMKKSLGTEAADDRVPTV